MRGNYYRDYQGSEFSRGAQERDLDYRNDYDDYSQYRDYYPQPDTMVNSKKKGRILTKGEFSDKHQGTFALNYDSTEEYKPSKKCFNRVSDDPIKPPEYIPPAQFKKTNRNPILQGDYQREPEPRVRPDQVSNVFNKQPINSQTEKRTNYNPDKNKSNIFDEFIPEPRVQRPQTTTQASELLQYKYAPNYRDAGVTAKPSNSRVDREGIKQYDDLKNFADVMKEKRNSSSIFFS